MAPRGERTHLRSPTAKEQAVPAPEAPPAAPPVWDAVFVLPKTAEWEPAAAEESGDIELGSMREKDFQDIGEAKIRFGIAPIDIGTACGGEPVSTLRPVDFIYGKYDRDEALQPLYAVPAGASSPFRSMHRLKLLGNVVCSNRRFGGCGIALPKRILKGEILAFIPLHDAGERAALYDAWVRAPWYARPSSLPFDAYKDYFGEQQGLYQVFQAHVTDYFLVLCVFAVASEALAHLLGERTVAAAVAHACFAFALCVWSTALLVTWSRKEKRVALEWGMTDFEDDEPPPASCGRDDFREISGGKQRDVVTVVRGRPPRPQFKGRIVKSPVDGGEEIFYHPKKRDGGVYWTPRARRRRTGARRRSSRDKLIIRLFVFNFINAYGSLYFTVFVQEHIDPKVKNIGNEWHCLENDCFYDLRYNVLFIMVISLVAATTTGTIIPLVTRKLNERREGGHEAEMSGPEWEYLLLEYDETQDSISRKLFPCAGADDQLATLDIGSFKSVYSFLNVAAALTNCAIVVYLPGLVNEGRRDACYMAAVAVMLGCVVAGRLASEDDDHDVALQVRRQEFINDKLIDRVADEDEKYHLDHDKPCDFTVDDRDDGPYHAALGDAFRRRGPPAGSSTFAATNPIEGAGTDVV
ncbi:intracellular chloride channel [Aureococcus anophagefferens]|nr:intracellular chloride channel [Aureococcus anophagefferens]